MTCPVCLPRSSVRFARRDDEPGRVADGLGRGGVAALVSRGVARQVCDGARGIVPPRSPRVLKNPIRSSRTTHAFPLSDDSLTPCPPLPLPPPATHPATQSSRPIFTDSSDSDVDLWDAPTREMFTSEDLPSALRRGRASSHRRSPASGGYVPRRGMARARAEDATATPPTPPSTATRTTPRTTLTSWTISRSTARRAPRGRVRTQEPRPGAPRGHGQVRDGSSRQTKRTLHILRARPSRPSNSSSVATSHRRARSPRHRRCSPATPRRHPRRPRRRGGVRRRRARADPNRRRRRTTRRRGFPETFRRRDADVREGYGRAVSNGTRMSWRSWRWTMTTGEARERIPVEARIERARRRRGSDGFADDVFDPRAECGRVGDRASTSSIERVRRRRFDRDGVRGGSLFIREKSAESRRGDDGASGKFRVRRRRRLDGSKKASNATKLDRGNHRRGTTIDAGSGNERRDERRGNGFAVGFAVAFAIGFASSRASSLGAARASFAVDVRVGPGTVIVRVRRRRVRVPRGRGRVRTATRRTRRTEQTRRGVGTIFPRIRETRRRKRRRRGRTRRTSRRDGEGARARSEGGTRGVCGGGEVGGGGGDVRRSVSRRWGLVAGDENRRARRRREIGDGVGGERAISPERDGPVIAIGVDVPSGWVGRGRRRRGNPRRVVELEATIESLRREWVDGEKVGALELAMDHAVEYLIPVGSVLIVGFTCFALAVAVIDILDIFDHGNIEMVSGDEGRMRKFLRRVLVGRLTFTFGASEDPPELVPT